MEKSKIKDILFNARNEFENEIDTYETNGGKELTSDDINIMFEFLDNYINKVELLVDDNNDELYYNGVKSSKNIELYKLTGDKKMKYLDDFITEYEWSVEEDEDNKGKYVIYDLQTDEIVEDKYTLEQVIDRVVGRALDYEIDEHGDDFYENFDLYYNHKSYIDYINGLYEIAKKYVKNEDKWLFKIGKDIREMTRFFEDVNK